MPSSPEAIERRKARDRIRHKATYVNKPKTANQLATTREYNKWRYAYSFYLIWCANNGIEVNRGN